MKVSLAQQFGHSAGRCATAFTDPALYPWFAKLPKVGVPEVLSRVVEDRHAEGDVIRLRIRYRFGGELNAAARAVIDPQKLTWIDESVHDLRARTVVFSLRPDHYDRQFRGRGSYRFVDTPGGCRREAELEVKVSFPVVGRAVEGAIASGLREHLDDEVGIVDAYLAASEPHERPGITPIASATMLLATWNVNSLKARLERVESWLGEVEPDVLCIQETKLADDAFPALTLAGLGYDGVHHGQGRWNGVAILSRIGIDDVVHGFADDGPTDPEARLLTARCGSTVVVTAYAPNGRAVGHEQFHYKLAWFDRLVRHLDAVAGPTDDLIVCGDLNIAPEDRDVWDIAEVHGSTHITDDERDRFRALLDWGMVDAFRQAHPDTDRLYTWWDYRAGNFHKHKGMRIDHVLASRPLAERLTWSLVDRNARKGTGPSDHAPLLAHFDAAAC